MNPFYTYTYTGTVALHRQHPEIQDGIVYYAGKGINDRCFEDHIRIPVPPPEHILRWEHASAKEAYAHEKELVAKYGRLDLGTGTLLNRTGGGAGHLDPNPENRVVIATNNRKWGHINAENGHMSRVGKQFGPINGRKLADSGRLKEHAKLQPRSARVKNGLWAVESGQLANNRTPEHQRAASLKASASRRGKPLSEAQLGALANARKVLARKRATIGSH